VWSRLPPPGLLRLYVHNEIIARKRASLFHCKGHIALKCNTIRGRPKKTFAVRGERVCLVLIFFGQRGRGFFKCGHPHVLVQKTTIFSKFMVCPHGQGGREVEPVRIFFGQGGRVYFLQFCADVFYGRPLTAMYVLLEVMQFFQRFHCV